MPEMLRMMRRFKTLTKERLKAVVEGASVGDLSFSAAGEDRLVLAWLEVNYQLSGPKIRYCDIGASHFRRLSNTYAIYLRGGSGVLIEPDPALTEQLKKRRPRDVVLNVGVAFDDRRSAKLKKFTASVFNTFSTEQANIVLEGSRNWGPDQEQKIVDEVEVRLVPINDILAQQFADGIHFMSIDAEGVDFLILKTIDFGRFKPKLICIERSRPVSEIDAVLGPWNYEFVAQTPDNAIYRLA